MRERRDESCRAPTDFAGGNRVATPRTPPRSVAAAPLLPRCLCRRSWSFTVYERPAKPSAQPRSHRKPRIAFRAARTLRDPLRLASRLTDQSMLHLLRLSGLRGAATHCQRPPRRCFARLQRHRAWILCDSRRERLCQSSLLPSALPASDSCRRADVICVLS